MTIGRPLVIAHPRRAFLRYDNPTGLAVIELLEFRLRGGADAGRAAASVAELTDRYLTRSRAHDMATVVAECVTWLAGDDPAPHPLRLEVSVTSAVVRASVTSTQPIEHGEGLGPDWAIEQALPLTTSLASRYGVERDHRTRIWAEFDRETRAAPAIATRNTPDSPSHAL
jgi:hypothetical protein